MMKWRFREGKLENAHAPSTKLLECYQFALCGQSSFLKLPISDAVWIRVSESQFHNIIFVESDGLMRKLKIFMLKGPGENLSIRFSIEQKNKTSFSLLIQLLSKFCKIGIKYS